MTLMCTMEKMTRETPVCTEGESPTLGALEVPTSSCWSRAVASAVCLMGHRLKINWIHVWMQQELIDTWELKNGG